MDSTEDFAILGSTRTFLNRSKDIFSSLDAIEASHKIFLKDPLIHNELLTGIKADPEEDKEKFICQEKNADLGYIFKQPRQKKLPFKKTVKHLNKDISKWTHYSLANVSLLTERSNKQVAEELLQKVNSNVEKNIDESIETTNVLDKHIFKKPNKLLIKKNNDQHIKALSWNIDDEKDLEDDDCSLSNPNQVNLDLPLKNTFKTIGSKKKSFRCSKVDDDDFCYDTSNNEKDFSQFCNSKQSNVSNKPIELDNEDKFIDELEKKLENE